VSETASPLRFDPLPGFARTTQARIRQGGLEQIHSLYGGLASGRLIIVGAAGSGKTSAAIMLVLTSLKHRANLPESARAVAPIPVLLNLSVWNPISTRLVSWAAKSLSETYLPYSPVSASQMEEFVYGGQVALILDGLDEMPAALRAKAIQALNEQAATIRIVLLSRSVELVESSTRQVLASAAAIELVPVSARDVIRYLSSTQLPSMRGRWDELIEHLRTNPSGPLAQALSTPLMLSLLRETYDTLGEPQRLFAGASPPVTADIEEVLLEELVTAAYSERPGQAPLRFTEEEATRALAFVASQMNRVNSADLAWWVIPKWSPLWWCAGGIGLVGGCTVGLITGLLVSIAFWPTRGLTYFLWTSIVCGVMYAIAAMLVERRRDIAPRRLGPLTRPFGLRGPALRGMMMGIVMGSVVVLVFVVLDLARSDGSGWDHTFTAMMAVGLFLAVSVAALIVAILSRQGVDDVSAIGPRSVWKSDLIYGLVSGPIAGTVAGPIVAFPFVASDFVTLGAGTVLEDFLGFSITFGVLVAVGFALIYPRTWWFAASVIYLHHSQGTPLRLLALFEEGRSLSLLRTVGPFYQFRHRRLQEKLASQRPTSGTKLVA
jgi:hypothetical protein